MANHSSGKKGKGSSVHARRAVAYIVLILISFLCLFWFYNASRSNSELGRGFTVLPGKYLGKNFYNLFHSSLPVVRGMVNSLIVAALSALLSTYFSTMTAYAIHAYRFAGRKAIFTFILGIMMIPTQVTALGFVKLVQSMKRAEDFQYGCTPADEAGHRRSGDLRLCYKLEQLLHTVPDSS